MGMRDRAAPLILLLFAGVIVAVSDEPLRGAAAISFLALVIPAWRSDTARWYTVLGVSTAIVLGLIWYVGSSTVRAWSIVICAAIITIPLMAEALADAIEARGEPRSKLHRLAKAILIAVFGHDHYAVGEGDGGGDC
jgi:hypothetical protein